MAGARGGSQAALARVLGLEVELVPLCAAACPWLVEMASICLSRVPQSWPSRGFRLWELCLALCPGFEGSVRLQSSRSLLRSLLGLPRSFLAGTARIIITKNKCVLPSILLFRGVLG